MLERICQAKGYSWWRDDAGGYILSAQPRKPAAEVVPVPSRKPVLTTKMQKLQFMHSQFLVYQLGLSDDPGPQDGMRDPQYQETLRTFSRGSGELRGMGMVGGGSPGGGTGFGGPGGGSPGGGAGNTAGRGRGATAARAAPKGATRAAATSAPSCRRACPRSSPSRC